MWARPALRRTPRCPGRDWAVPVGAQPPAPPQPVLPRGGLAQRACLAHREDITYRLPELDPRGSDEENADSETSASTESLLEKRAGRGAPEGQY